MQELLTYNSTQDFNPDYNIQVIGVISGSVTVTLLTKDGGTSFGNVGTIAAGECKAITPGRASVRVTVVGSAEYVIA